MTDKNIEFMKKTIAAQKQKSAEQGGAVRRDKMTGKKITVDKKYKKGGLFDK